MKAGRGVATRHGTVRGAARVTSRRFQTITATASFLLASLIGFDASAQTYNKTMVAGGALALGHYASVNPDCSSKGKTTVRLSSAPAHGSVRLREGRGFSFFQSYQQCNSRRVEGVTVEYRPERGFLGADTVGLDILYPSGNERMTTYYITVK
jgi:hypothetical protein